MFYVQTDLLKEARLNTGFTKARLDAIVKNTGLPEFVKLRNTERFKEHLRNNFIGDSAIRSVLITKLNKDGSNIHGGMGTMITK
jgi:hypothetical protein